VLSITTPHTAYKTVKSINVHSIGEHDEQKILDVELVVFDLKHKVSTTRCELQISLENSDFHNGIKVY